MEAEGYEAEQHQAMNNARQTEEEGTPLPQLALDTESAAGKDGGCLLVFFNNAPAVHQAEAEALAVLVVMRAYLRGIVHFAVVQGVHVFGREADTRIRHPHFHTILHLLSREGNTSALGGELAGVVAEGVHHE